MVIMMYDTAKHLENEFKQTGFHGHKSMIHKYNKGDHKLVGDYEFPYSIIDGITR